FTINRLVYPDPFEESKVVELAMPTLDNFSVKTDFTRSHKLLRHRKNQMVVLAAPSQVHEFIIHYLLTNHKKIKGINFVVRNPARMIIEIQIQITKWDKIFRKKKWRKRCWEMSKMVSGMMPVGLCNIKPI